MNKYNNRLSGEGSIKRVETGVEQDQHVTGGEVSGRKAIRAPVLNEVSGGESNNGSTSSNNTGTLPIDDKRRKSGNRDRPQCDPCRTEEMFAIADMYCQNCNEFLCKTCVRFHRKFSATGAHSLRRIQDATYDIHPPAELHLDHQRDRIKSKLYDMIPAHCIDINIKTVDDKNDCNITGCELLSSGNLAVCDNENCALKILDMTSHQIIAKYNLYSNPWDVTVTNEQEVAVSLPFEKMIQLFSFSTSNAKVTCIRCLKVDGTCLGIEYYNNHFIVSYANKLEMVSMCGTVTRSFRLKMDTKLINHSDPWYIAVSHAQNCLYVSYRDSREVSRLLINTDQHIRRLIDEDISYPAGICLANDSELVVCNWDTHTIQLYGIIHGLGQRLLLDEGYGLKHPQAVCFSDEQKKLFVSSYWYDGDPKYLNNIKVFQFMHMVM